MKALLRNNIFTNPEEWAKEVGGNSWRYRCTQAATVFFSFGLFVMSYVVACLLPWSQYLSAVICIAPVTILSLCYLRALRYLYLRNRQEESDQPATAADRDDAAAE